MKNKNGERGCEIFNVGDKVTIAHFTYPKEWDFLQFMRGKVATITYIDCQNRGHCPGGKCGKCTQNYIHLKETNSISFKPSFLKKVKETQVNKIIIEMFPSTKDAVLIQKWFGDKIEDDPLTRMLIKGKESELLTEAEKLEKEEIEKSK